MIIINATACNCKLLHLSTVKSLANDKMNEKVMNAHLGIKTISLFLSQHGGEYTAVIFYISCHLQT